MQVDFDNMRRQTANAFDALCKNLNAAILKPVDGQPNYIQCDGGKRMRCENADGNIYIEPDRIQRNMDNLRNCIVTLCCIYKDTGDDQFGCVELKDLASFNEEAE